MDFFNKITNIQGKYFTLTGKNIDSELIYAFADSFTDLYEADAYEYEYTPEKIDDGTCYSFAVRVYLQNEEEIIVRSDTGISCFSLYYCYLPWYIEYNGNLYVQYNGRIPSALLNIVTSLNGVCFCYEEKSHWGCFSERVPDNYVTRGISPDFPQSTLTESPEETLGRDHVMWEVDVNHEIKELITGFPLYSGGNICIITGNGLMWFDSESGEKVDEVIMEDPVLCFFSGEKVFLTVEGSGLY